MTASSPSHLSDPSGLATDDAPGVLRTAFEWLPVGVLIVSEDGAIAMVNRELERMFGYSSVELVGHPVETLVPHGSRLAHERLREDFLERQQPHQMGAGRELFGRRKDGAEIPIDVRLTPIVVSDARFVLASIVDLSERRRFEQAVLAQREDLLRFEALVGELGAEFVNLRPESVDRTIEEALGRVVRVLDLDRSTLFQLTEETSDFRCTHQWTRPGLPVLQPRVSAMAEFPWLLAQIRDGETVTWGTLEDIPHQTDKDNLQRLGTRAGVAIPLIRNGRTWGAVTFGSARSFHAWSPDVMNRLRVLTFTFASVLARKQADQSLRRQIEESGTLRDRLRDENSYLRHALKASSGAATITGNSPAFRHVLQQLREVARTSSPVLLRGETGTGKELLAMRIHELSPRRDHSMMRVNCLSLSAEAIEDGLSANKGGTRNSGDRPVSRLDLARGSTLFLDEVADLPAETQASLSHVLQGRRSHGAGDAKAQHADVRIIAATQRDLQQCIADGTFREDLYYRINVFPIEVPPLRQRPDDIPLLVWRFVDEFSEAYGKPVDAIDKESMVSLQRYNWPGNARELRNVVERAVIVATSRHLHIPAPTLGVALPGEPLAVVEREHIAATLAACDGRIEGKDGAAARLGLTSRRLRQKMAALGVALQNGSRR